MPLLRDGRVGQLRCALGHPAGQLDVGRQAHGVEARVKVPILDRPITVQDVAEVQANRMAAADSVGKIAEALDLFELARAHRTTPAVAISTAAVAASPL